MLPVLQGRKRSRDMANLKATLVLTFIVLKHEFVKEAIDQISTHLAQHIFG